MMVGLFCRVILKSMNALLDFLQLFPKYSHGLADDGNWREGIDRFDLEDVPVFLLADA